ncbi:PepSY domain-containing protein [Methylobacterium radiodurans]|uniref:Peptidase M4 n=1 Tax=Methylobacterium radiodurans TaxID=2202828 RepID=A0A2U8VM13_9HYPH|nr:PepSY domain-containing protein [Methylobacterium radiodurans]AWN34709.1 peptidase M4 [Methylobacterium radiodurans]
MKTTAFRLTAAAGLLALSAGLAAAQTTTTTPAPSTTTNPDLTKNPENTGRAPTATEATKSNDGNLKEWQVAKSAKIGLAQAIATAEAKAEDNEKGKAIDADFEKADGKNPAHYSIKVVYPSGKLVEHGVNADTGELYKSENQPFERYFTRLKVSDFQNAKVSLKDAIALAEQKAAGGKAYEAEVEREGNAVEYEIKVALTDREQEIKVGPDGKVKND